MVQTHLHVRVDIVLTCENVHKPRLFITVTVPSQESKWQCKRVLEKSSVPLFQQNLE